MLADWLRVATDAALRIRAGTLNTTTTSFLASDDRTFYPIECIKLPDGSWQHTPTTMTITDNNGNNNDLNRYTRRKRALINDN